MGRTRSREIEAGDARRLDRRLRFHAVIDQVDQQLTIACGCTSLPGVPYGANTRPSFMIKPGLGVKRGRFPGARTLGCPSSTQD